MEPGQDKVLIIALHNGDDRALAKLYDLFHAQLYYFSLHIVDNTAEAEEIAADSFVKLWKIRDRFFSIEKIKAFLFVSARNACCDLLKDKKRLTLKNDQLAYFLSQTESSFLAAIESGPGLHEIKAEVVRQILNEAENLPEQCKKIFTLSFIHGLKNAEIAEKMGLTLQTVKNQKTRALKLLKTAVINMEIQLSWLALLFLPVLVFN